MGADQSNSNNKITVVDQRESEKQVEVAKPPVEERIVASGMVVRHHLTYSEKDKDNGDADSDLATIKAMSRSWVGPGPSINSDELNEMSTLPSKERLYVTQHTQSMAGAKYTITPGRPDYDDVKKVYTLDVTIGMKKGYTTDYDNSLEGTDSKDIIIANPALQNLLGPPPEPKPNN